MPAVHQRNLMITRNAWNALMRNGGSIDNIQGEGHNVLKLPGEIGKF